MPSIKVVNPEDPKQYVVIPKLPRERRLRARRIFRLDTIQRHFRLWRIMWERGQVGDGKGFSAKFTIGLAPHWWASETLGRYDRMFTLFGLRLHYSRSYGGRFV